MKKLLVTALIAAMSITVLTGCGGTEASTPGTTEGTEVVSTPDWTEYEALITSIKAETDLAAREEMMHKAEDILMDTGAIVPLYYYNDVFMMKDTVKGMYTNNYGHKFFELTSTPNGILRANIGSEPAKLDPALSSSVDGSILAKMNFEGLYSYDEEGNVSPALAEGVEVSEDGLTYTFTMKKDLKWSDGSTLDASDFAYSWKRAVAPETASDYGYMLDPIARDEAGELAVVASEDGSTLTVTLAAPCAYFLDLTAFTTYLPVPQEAVEAAATDTDPGAWALEAGFIGNGAFLLKEWVHDEKMVYEANPNYYRADEVKLERIELMLSSDDTAILTAYNAGNLDFIDSIPADEMTALVNSPEFYKIDQLGTYFATFNVKSPIFEGKTAEQAAAMRKAISLIVDRDYIVEAAAQSGQQIATSFVPAAILDGQGGEFKVNDDAYTFPEADHVGYVPEDSGISYLEEASALMEEAGYEIGADGKLVEPLELTYLTNTGTGHEAIAELMQQDLAAIGIDLKISTSEWNVFLEERKQGHFDFCRDGWVADFNDPINFLDMWTAESGNNNAQLGK